MWRTEFGDTFEKIEDALEQLTGQTYPMKEGVSETVRDGDPGSQLEDGSTPSIAPGEHTPHTDAIVEGQSRRAASSKSPADAEDQTMDHRSDVDMSSRDTEQGSVLKGVEPILERICQQVGGDTNDNQMTVPVEGKDVEMTGDKTEEGDGGLLAGNLTQADELPEEMDIQEDDLIKTVIEAFEVRHLVETRPIPVLVKGKEVDLVQLSFQVRACGGYDQGVENRRLVANQAVQSSPNALKRENEDSVKPESVKSQSKSRGVTSAKKKSLEDGSTIDNSSIDHSAASFAEGSESFAAFLDWVKRLALNPGDPRKGQGVRVSRWSEAWVGKCETLARRVREVLWKNHEHPLHDFSPPESQDQESEGKKRGRGRIKGSGKKARRLSN
ncbi:hypothetical protein GOP47_0007305 [Adiantum capillus-veneris]|uniref:Uncharacterized protein n=1 Tax=Adiantum capillus-veneris TaxID=13818 RepID=A0A9D4V114_ADICA|nr:hypothetical protein GOP47_0007305 [Adiantum capillus-veneris]